MVLIYKLYQGLVLLRSFLFCDTRLHFAWRLFALFECLSLRVPYLRVTHWLCIRYLCLEFRLFVCIVVLAPLHLLVVCSIWVVGNMIVHSVHFLQSVYSHDQFDYLMCLLCRKDDMMNLLPRMMEKHKSLLFCFDKWCTLYLFRLIYFSSVTWKARRGYIRFIKHKIKNRR